MAALALQSLPGGQAWLRRAVVDAYLVLEGGQARLLPYIGRFRTGESTGRMLEIVNARLDELWAWGVEHGSSSAPRSASPHEVKGGTAGLG